MMAPTARHGSFDPEGARRWLRTAKPGPGAALLWLPVPAAPMARLVAVLGTNPEVVWHDPVGASCVGFGAAAVITASGEDRFATVEREVTARLGALAVRAPSGEPPRARVFGGFAFRPGGADAGGWRGFGDARFVLPRLTYVAGDTGAWLGVTARPEEREEEWRAAIERAVALAAALEPRANRAAPAGEAHVEPALHARVTPADDPALVERLRRARDAVARGELEKVVLAHHVQLRLAPPPDPAALVGRLLDDNPTSTIFAFQVGDRCFLGATPERLVARTGRRVVAEALAGSAVRGTASDAAALLFSEKDLAEHRFVVRALADELRPLAEVLEVPAQPVLRELRHVVHLHTPVVARLAGSHHVVELVRRLHPTPAVGGTPTADALAWQAQHEPFARGWYASPVGWIDAEGDGDFVVALRSGLLHGDQAELHAGAGIVADSDPAAEVAEIRVKLATFLGALGIEAT